MCSWLCSSAFRDFLHGSVLTLRSCLAVGAPQEFGERQQQRRAAEPRRPLHGRPRRQGTAAAAAAAARRRQRRLRQLPDLRDQRPQPHLRPPP